MRPVRLSLLLVVVGALACASPGPGAEPRPIPVPAASTLAESPAPSPEPGSGERDQGDRVVATVGEKKIRESDLGEFVIRYFRDRANEALTHLIDTIVLSKEAGLYGIHVPPDLLRAAVEEQLEARQRTIHSQFGSGVSLEEYLRDRYGITLAEHRQDLAELVATRMLRDRVIRYTGLREERVRVRDAVFPDLESATRAANSARDGADLGRLAEESGVGPSQVTPPLAAADFTPLELGRVAIALESGDISPPVAVEADGRTAYHVLKGVSREAAQTESWEVLRIGIEAGIKSRPVEQWEYTLWARKMREKYRARVLR